MALYIKGPDSNGDCCDCSTRLLPCDTCGPASTCECALVLPVFGLPPDVNYAAAAARLAFVGDCLCAGFGSANPAGGTVTADNSTPNTLIISADNTISVSPPFSLAISMYSSVTVSADAVLDISWNIPSRLSSGFNRIEIYQCSYNLGSDPIEFYDITANTGSHSMAALPAGTYVIICSAQADVGFDHFQATFTISTTSTMVVNPAIAKWDDSGTTRNLEACPKTNIPDTFGEGDWYANETAAQTAITNYTSNCVGYCRNFISFTATDGGSSLTFAGERFGGAGLVCWGSISLLAAGTITFTYSNSLGGFSTVYADDGITVVASFSGAGPHTTASLSPGKYYVNTNQNTDGSHPAGNVIITSSASITVNPIQALYNRSVDCPARLDC